MRRTVRQTGGVSMRWGRRTWTLVTLAVLAAALAATAYEATRPSERERVETPIADRPLDCDGPTTRAGDPPRDLDWSPSDDFEQIDQEAAEGDVRSAALTSVPGALCLELRLRKPVPSQLDLGLRIYQRQPAGFDASSDVYVELRDGTAVGTKTVRGDGEQMKTVLFGVRASAVGDTVRVRVPARQVEWRLVSLARPFRWMADTGQDAGHGYQQVDSTRWVRHGFAEGR